MHYVDQPTVLYASSIENKTNKQYNLGRFYETHHDTVVKCNMSGFH